MLREENVAAAEVRLRELADNPDATLLLARLLVRAGRARDARPQLDRWLQAAPDDFRARQMRAWVAEALGNEEEARRQLGRQDMQDAVTEAGGPAAEDTRLRLALAGRDPGDGMTDIAYEKGSAFLQTVETVVGRERLDAFLKDYFDHFAFQPMSSERMMAYMDEKLLSDEEVARIDLRAWIFEPGVPANIPPAQSGAFAAVERQVESWKSGAAASTLQTAEWSTQEWLHFLRALPDTIPAARLRELDNTFKLSTIGNNEVLFERLGIAIRSR